MSISVPQAVKEALQDGRMRKNYRFKVYKYGIRYIPVYSVIEPHYGIDFEAPEENGYYKIYTNNTDISFQFIRHNWDHEPTTYNSTSNTYQSYVECEIYHDDTEFYIDYDFMEYPGTEFIIAYRTNEYEWEKIFEIDNNYLVAESVSFDERMCSGSTLKFGLCEGTSLEFQYFNYENINGCRIEAFIDVYYGEAEPYEIPMGWFDVVQCPVQASTGIRKVTAYNKLRSSYLDSTKAVSDLINEGEDGITGSISVHKLLEEILSEDTITEEPTYEEKTITRDTTLSNGGVVILSAGNGNYLRVIYGTVYIYTANQSTDKYYRYTIKARDIWDTLAGFILAGYYVYVSGGYEALDHYIKRSVLRMTLGGYATVNNMNSEQIYKSSIFSNAGVLPTPQIFVSPEMSHHDKIGLTIPLYVNETTSQGSDTPTYSELSSASSNWVNTVFPAISDNKSLIIDQAKLNALEEVRLTSANSQDVTIRELQSAAFEVSCQFGKLDRVTDLFSGVTLNYGRLLPASSLYPANTLYPAGSDADTNPSHYQQLWTDDGGTDKFKYLIITYKSGDSEAKLQRTVNSDGTVNYNMSDNWLLKNLSWTAEQVSEIADAMVPLMRNISWFPFEMWAPGLPYLETGDEIEIQTPNGTYTSYILQRTLKGIQNLMDTFINGELDTF